MFKLCGSLWTIFESWFWRWTDLRRLRFQYLRFVPMVFNDFDPGINSSPGDSSTFYFLRLLAPAWGWDILSHGGAGEWSSIPAKWRWKLPPTPSPTHGLRVITAMSSTRFPICYRRDSRGSFTNTTDVSQAPPRPQHGNRACHRKRNLLPELMMPDRPTRPSTNKWRPLDLHCQWKCVRASRCAPSIRHFAFSVLCPRNVEMHVDCACVLVDAVVFP